MNLSKQQLEAAVDHGIKLFSGAITGTVIPYSDNVFVLKQLLMQLASGSIALSPVMQQKQAGQDQQIAPNRQQRRAAAAAAQKRDAKQVVSNNPPA